MSSSLLDFHVLTVCNQTGTFAGFIKKTCWKVLVNVSPDVSSVFRSVSQCEISDEIKAGLEEFVLDLYCKDRPLDVNTLGSLGSVDVVNVRPFVPIFFSELRFL